MPINKEKIYTSSPRPELNFIFPLLKKKNKTSRIPGEFKYKGHGRCLSALSGTIRNLIPNCRMTNMNITQKQTLFFSRDYNVYD